MQSGKFLSLEGCSPNLRKGVEHSARARPLLRDYCIIPALARPQQVRIWVWPSCSSPFRCHPRGLWESDQDPESTDLERFVGFHGMLTLGTSLFDFSFFGKTYGNMNCLRSEVCSRTPAPVLRSVQRLTCICKTSKRLAAASDRHLAPAKFPQSFSCRQ